MGVALVLVAKRFGGLLASDMFRHHHQGWRNIQLFGNKVGLPMPALGQRDGFVRHRYAPGIGMAFTMTDEIAGSSH